jgi:hypothetical protein
VALQINVFFTSAVAAVAVAVAVAAVPRYPLDKRSVGLQSRNSINFYANVGKSKKKTLPMIRQA